MSRTAQTLRTVARRLEKVPDAGCRDAAVAVARQAQTTGHGRFAGYRLGAAVDVSGRGSVFVRPRPAGFWSITTFGRSAVRPVRAKVLRFRDGGFRAHAGAAGPIPRRSWERVSDYADDIVPATFVDMVHDAVTRR